MGARAEVIAALSGRVPVFVTTLNGAEAGKSPSAPKEALSALRMPAAAAAALTSRRTAVSLAPCIVPSSGSDFFFLLRASEPPSCQLHTLQDARTRLPACWAGRSPRSSAFLNNFRRESKQKIDEISHMWEGPGARLPAWHRPCKSNLPNSCESGAAACLCPFSHAGSVSHLRRCTAWRWANRTSPSRPWSTSRSGFVAGLLTYSRSRNRLLRRSINNLERWTVFRSGLRGPQGRVVAMFACPGHSCTLAMSAS